MIEINDEPSNEAVPAFAKPMLAAVYGCPQCGSKSIIEDGDNHHQTNHEMEYLEYVKCLECGHGFVE